MHTTCRGVWRTKSFGTSFDGSLLIPNRSCRQGPLHLTPLSSSLSPLFCVLVWTPLPYCKVCWINTNHLSTPFSTSTHKHTHTQTHTHTHTQTQEAFIRSSVKDKQDDTFVLHGYLPSHSVDQCSFTPSVPPLWCSLWFSLLLSPSPPLSVSWLSDTLLLLFTCRISPLDRIVSEVQ